MSNNIDYEVVEKLLNKTHVKKGQFYSAVGISRQNFSNFKAQGYIPAKHARNIANFFGINVDDLYQANTSDISIIQTETDSYIELPTIDAGAGAEALAVERAEKLYYPKDLLPDHIKLDENTLAIKIAGNSMEPLYYENDIVFIDMVNGRGFVEINGTYLVRYGNTVQIKDVEFLGNGEVLLLSRNSPAIINPKKEGLELEIVGKPFAMLHPTFGSKLKIKS